MSKGVIFYEPWVRCGECNDSVALTPTVNQTAAGYAKEIGWKLTRLYGWLCPRCQAKVPELL